MPSDCELYYEAVLHDPYLLLLSVWALVASVGQLAELAGLLHAQPLSSATIGALICGLVGWGVGDACADAAFRVRSGGVTAVKHEKPVVYRRAVIALAALFTLSVVGYVAFIKTWGVLSLAVAPDSVAQLNARITGREEAFGGLLGRLYVLPSVGLALTIYLHRRRIVGGVATIAFSAAFVIMLVSPRRALLIQGILLATFVSILMAGRGYRWLIAAGVALLAIFGLSQVALLKTAATVEGVLTPIVVYIAGNIPAMETLIRTPHFEETYVIFNVPMRGINQLYGASFPTDLAVPFVDVSSALYTNTIPYQYYLYKDGGILGVVLGSLVLGFLAKAIACRARMTGTFLSVWATAAFLVFVVFSFREFTLITYDWAFFFVVVGMTSAWIHRPA